MLGMVVNWAVGEPKNLKKLLAPSVPKPQVQGMLRIPRKTHAT